jgi:glycosyltransferase involved in cell wall biosynthesis
VLPLLPGGALEPEFRAAGVTVAALGADPRRRPARALRRLLAVVRETRPEAVFGWMYHGCLAAVLAKAARPSAQLLWSIHHTLDRWDEEKASTRMLVRALAAFAWAPRRIQFCSARSADTHLRRGFSRRRSRVIPNGFDIDRFTPAAEAPARPRRRVGHVARLHPMKDHANFIAAAGALVRRRRDVEFVMAGAEVTADNPLLRTLIAEHGMNGEVALLGRRRDLPALMAGLDVLVVSSAWGEAFPIVIGEAMAAGTPCVATDVGDAAAIIGDTGRIVPVRDPEALADAVAALLDEDEARFRQRRRRCRERIVERFSLDAATDRFVALAAGAA